MLGNPGFSYAKFTLAKPSFGNTISKPGCTGLIMVFVTIKVGLNLLAMAHFGFQRDELLYVALGDHLDWGYKEVPPFIALLAKISATFFGSTLFYTRIFSTIFSGLIIWFTGQVVIELGGRKFAIALACVALIFSPAFAASGYLFEPVVFDQLWWLLTIWLLIKYINTSSVKYLYFIGLVIGIGLLTKYTMAFFAVALILALLVTRQRKILWNRHLFGATAIALLIFLPNMKWELNHHLPILTQMRALRAEQLVYITPFDFIVQQLLVNGITLFLWPLGLCFLLFSDKMRKFRFLAFSYLFVFIILMALSGKNYYIFGAYPMLFAAGGCYLESRLKQKSHALRSLVLTFFIAPNLILFPLVLPLFSLEQTMGIFSFEYKHFPFFSFEAKWDDNKLHPLSQNYGDMFGWDEMAEKVAKVYNSLSFEQQKHTQIYTDNYGEASSLHLYGKQYHLPEAVCLNSSFSLWAPPNLNADYIIYVHEKSGVNAKRFQPEIENYQQLNEIKNPLAIEKGTGIFLLIHPKPAFNSSYQKTLAQMKLE
jgi:hypothetical protein